MLLSCTITITKLPKENDNCSHRPGSTLCESRSDGVAAVTSASPAAEKVDLRNLCSVLDTKAISTLDLGFCVVAWLDVT
jgi:hypothetical protein